MTDDRLPLSRNIKARLLPCLCCYCWRLQIDSLHCTTTAFGSVISNLALVVLAFFLHAPTWSCHCGENLLIRVYICRHTCLQAWSIYPARKQKFSLSLSLSLFLLSLSLSFSLSLSPPTHLLSSCFSAAGSIFLALSTASFCCTVALAISCTRSYVLDILPLFLWHTIFTLIQLHTPCSVFCTHSYASYQIRLTILARSLPTPFSLPALYSSQPPRPYSYCQLYKLACISRFSPAHSFRISFFSLQRTDDWAWWRGYVCFLV